MRRLYNDDNPRDLHTSEPNVHADLPACGGGLVVNAASQLMLGLSYYVRIQDIEPGIPAANHALDPKSPDRLQVASPPDSTAHSVCASDPRDLYFPAQNTLAIRSC